MPVPRVPAFLALSVVLVGCKGTGCPDGARVEKEGGFCVVLPSGYKKASDNSKDGRAVYAYGQTGKMSMFVTSLSAEERGRTVKDIEARLAAPSENPKVLDLGKTADAAFQLFQWKGQTAVSLEYVTLGERPLRCTGTVATEAEARALLSACRTLSSTP